LKKSFIALPKTGVVIGGNAFVANMSIALSS
jgi:hypothetical protein